MQLRLDAEEAVEWLRRSVNANRTYAVSRCVLGAALALTGELVEARAAASAGLALYPGFGVGRMRSADSSDDAAYLACRDRLCHGLRLAGVPEG